MVIVVLVVGLFIYSGVQARKDTKIFPNVTIAGVNVGNLSQESAVKKLQDAGIGSLNETLKVNLPMDVSFEIDTSAACFGVTPKEISQMNRHDIVLIHFGGVKNHIIYKARHVLRNINKPVIIIAQYPVDFEDFARIGVKTTEVMPDNPETKGTIVDLITDVIRGETCTQEKLDEVKAKLISGEIKVFDTATFTVDGKTVTEYMADVDSDEAFTPDTQVVADGYFHESEYRSAPYFDLVIDGITIK